MPPHVIAVTCPPRVIGDGGQQSRFIDMNAPVLAGASHIIIEAHNGCAGLAYFYKARLDKLARDGSRTPFFELQRQLLEQGIDRFARQVAARSGRALVVTASYVDFDGAGSVAGVTGIRTVQIDSVRPTEVPLWPRLTDFQAMSGYNGSTQRAELP
jgi:hypothetical protein